MKHVLLTSVLLLIGLAVTLGVRRSHQPLHVSDTGPRQAEGMTPAPVLVLPAVPAGPFTDGSGRLAPLTPESPSAARPVRTGLDIPDEDVAGRLTTPRAGQSGSVWRELKIPE